jgi:hypothetical protein
MTPRTASSQGTQASAGSHTRCANNMKPTPASPTRSVRDRPVPVSASATCRDTRDDHFRPPHGTEPGGRSARGKDGGPYVESECNARVAQSDFSISLNDW